jgi:diguanylate cyclase (GGDEF)-like protein
MHLVDDSRERKLSDVLSEFARTMATDFPIQAILDHLITRIVGLLPVTAAGVTLIRPDEHPRHIGASDAAALRYEELQSELGEGPCLLAYTTGAAVQVPDLRQEHRFPAFTARGLQEGLRAVFTFPLRQGDHQLGALDLYRDTPGGLSAWALRTAQTLADVATAYLINARAREELMLSAERSRNLALHDALTGLPNRTLMLELLDHALQRDQRTEKSTAVLFLDLDDFKAVNDTYGHGVGDQLLVAVARRLRHLIRTSDTVARMHGDEFVVLCEDLNSADDADAIATRLLDAMAEPFTLAAVRMEVTVSIGITLADHHHHRDAKQLLRDADTAMYEAKRGGGGHEVFDPRVVTAVDREGLHRDLQHAIPGGELHTVYQPIVTTGDGALTGFEALLRWRHPTRGEVPPTTFIPLAEQSALIRDIGAWVLHRACADQRRWHHQHPTTQEFGVAVNVSTRQLMAAGFPDTVAAVLTSQQLDPRLLTLEVTESVFVRDSKRALMVLNDLKDLGVTIALDDFGTGYCSLSYLNQFPVDIVKIDRTFIANLGLDPVNDIIVTAVVQLAHALQMTVIAEGIETLDQHRTVTALGCDAGQGFYFARPMPAGNVDTLLHTGARTGLRLPPADIRASRPTGAPTAPSA